MAGQHPAETLIHSYIAAWNARDYSRMAAHFTEPSVFILSSGTSVQRTRRELEEFLREIFKGLEAAGFGHTEIGAITLRRCAESLLLADVADIRRFHRDGSLMQTIEVQYTLREGPAGEWLMVSALWCQQGWQSRAAV